MNRHFKEGLCRTFFGKATSDRTIGHAILKLSSLLNSGCTFGDCLVPRNTIVGKFSKVNIFSSLSVYSPKGIVPLKCLNGHSIDDNHPDKHNADLVLNIEQVAPSKATSRMAWLRWVSGKDLLMGCSRAGNNLYIT